jgi:hypothetical protein
VKRLRLSIGKACRCRERTQVQIGKRKWYVHHVNRYGPSIVWCAECRAVWRTSANYVSQLLDCSMSEYTVKGGSLNDQDNRR